MRTRSALYQIGQDKVIEPIAFMGRKFTDAALKWYTDKKKCYFEYASMKAFKDTSMVDGSTCTTTIKTYNKLQPLQFPSMHECGSTCKTRFLLEGTDNWAADFMSRMHESHKLNVVNT